MVKQSIADELRTLLPRGTVCRGGLINDKQEDLFPEEESAILDAIERRRSEFRAGRAYARQALADLGVARVAIPRAFSRAPIWPASFVGSISHTRTQCVAVVARSADQVGLGADIELNTPLDPELTLEVQRADEAGNFNHGLDLGKLLFVIKEAVYKAYFPLAGRLLGFGEVVVEISPDRCAFTARLASTALPTAKGNHSFSGRFSTWQDHILAVAVPGAWRDGDMDTATTDDRLMDQVQ